MVSRELSNFLDHDPVFSASANTRDVALAGQSTHVHLRINFHHQQLIETLVCIGV